MSFDFRAIYRSHRELLTALVVGLAEDVLASTVPATPLWTVKDESLGLNPHGGKIGGVLGTGPGGITVRGESFDITRALFGRRSLDQIAAFEWSEDPAPHLPYFSFFTPRETPLAE